MQWGVVTYMADEVKEPITLSDNKLAWFSGADLPHSQDPTNTPNAAISFGLDSTISHLQGFFQSRLGLEATRAASALCRSGRW